MTYRPLVTTFDKKKFAVFVYCDDANPDKSQFGACKINHTRHLSIEELAEQIRKDKIDILIELNGHCANNRLPVFNHRPAPVQMTWSNFNGTSGLKNADFLLASEALIPQSEEKFFSEKIVKHPDSYIMSDLKKN